MSFDGIMTRHVVAELKNAMVGGRIVKIYQLGRFDVLFHVRKAASLSFLMSVSPPATRLQQTKAVYETPSHPPRFGMFLRKHAEGALIDDLKQHDNDRIVVFSLMATNHLGERVSRSLIYEGFGKDANIILLDETGAVMDALKRIGPFDGTRTIQPGARYQFPEDTRIDPTDTDAIAHLFETAPPDSPRDLTQRVQGISPLFAREFTHRATIGNLPPAALFETMIAERHFHILSGVKTVFSSVRLGHLDGEETVYDTTQALLDAFYTVRDRKERLRVKKKELTRFVQRRLERLADKLEALSRDLEKAMDNETEQLYGQLVLTHQHRIQRGDRILKCAGFDGEKEYDIALDARKTPVQNSAEYFRAYKKKKAAIPHLKRERSKAKDDLDYFTLLKAQLDDADNEDIEDIREELVRQRYIKKSAAKKKTPRARARVYEDAEGVLILVGKNNRQNAEITHKEAHPNDVWFHVQGASGSHVVARAKQPLPETTLRTCAQLAAVFSPQKSGSSVPVDYTDVRRVKKIPGKRDCFVRYDGQKTIYIDPDPAFVEQLIKKA